MKYKVLSLILFSQISFAQIVPSFQGVYDKKSSPTSINYSLAFDGSNDHITTNGGTISSAWSVEIWFKKSQNKSAHNLTNNSNSNNSGTWSLRLGQWDNRNKIGITKYGTKDYYIDNSITDTDIDEWEHIAWTYESNRVRIYVNGEYIGNTFRSHQSSSTTNNLSATLYWNIIGKSSNTIDGEIDELRIWNDKRTDDEIKANMFIELEGDEANLIAYYKMSDGSGTTLTDNASAGDYDGSMTNMTTEDWVTSYVPIVTFNLAYKTDMEGLWEATGTSTSQASNGLTMSVSSTLSEENFAVFGNNNTSSTSTSDLPSGTVIRSARIWQVDKSGTVSANVIIDISDATGNSPTIGDATNYKLLHRIGTSGNFTTAATGASVSGDNIIFSGVTIHKGFYVIAATQSSNL